MGGTGVPGVPMSLISFHRLLITAAILFCGGYAAWEFSAYGGDGDVLSLVLGITFAILAGGLIYYLVNLQRFLDRRTG